MSLDGQGWLLRASDPMPAFSANPLELLPARQRLVFLGKAFRVPMAHVARALGMSRETAYQDLRAATAVLEPHRPGLRQASADAGQRAGFSRLHERSDTPASRSMERLLTVKETAAKLGLSNDGVRYLHRTGKLRAANIRGDGEREFAPADVEALRRARASGRRPLRANSDGDD